MVESVKRPAIIHILIVLSLAVFAWSGVRPHDYPTWALETLPAMIGFVLILYFWKRFPLSNLLLGLICVHAIVLCVGGKYTYAEVPFGFWLKHVFHFERNPYDRIGHIFQGLTPALLSREIILRRHILPCGGWTNFFVICICLAFSAFYELIEWWVALLSGSDAVAFLATQGDPFDTQADMFCALLAAIFAVAVLSRWQDRDSVLKVIKN